MGVEPGIVAEGEAAGASMVGEPVDTLQDLGVAGSSFPTMMADSSRWRSEGGCTEE